MDQNGKFVWAKQFGSKNNDMGYSIAVDNSGNIYSTGSFQGTVDFDPSADVYNLVSDNGGEDIFVSKLDSSGKFVWAKRLGGPCLEVGFSIAVDAKENVYLTGFFQGTVDFDPSNQKYKLTSSSNDIFVVKLNSKGSLKWARKLGGLSNDEGKSVKADKFGNVYLTGSFSSTADFDPSGAKYNLTSIGNTDIFIEKLDSNGYFKWAKQLGGSIDEDVYDLAIDNYDGVYTTGTFIGKVDFNPDTTSSYSLTSVSVSATNPHPYSKDIFIEKLDTAGNFVWATKMGGRNEDFGSSIIIDFKKNVYTTGHFMNTADFDMDSSTKQFELTSAGNFDVFVHKIKQCLPNDSLIVAKSCSGYYFNNE
ncbi:MAG: SBBP repeat-containing protein [Bacteroidetes bacterium]|nr:SBBP repeat-containing protein [Bacteroidota bacterium]